MQNGGKIMATMQWYDSVAYILVSAGAITWLTEKWMAFNIVEKFIPASMTKYVYGLIGIAGIYGLITFFNLLKK